MLKVVVKITNNVAAEIHLTGVVLLLAIFALNVVH